MSIQSSTAGYPVIGENREWKRALEAFWFDEITESELLSKTKEIRLANLEKQQKAGIDFIAVGDFTLYDRVLDTAVMFSLIPKRFDWDGQDISTALYFSMARGNDQAVACEMTKWFDTNYHYIVPEFEGQRLKLTENKPLQAYKEAKQELGIEGKPVLIGPYTFLKLSKGYSEKDIPAIVLQLLPLYAQILNELKEAGAQWVQIDEPILTTSISEDEMKTVTEIYTQLARETEGINILLQTYFESIEHYEAAAALPVAGIGIDFVYGKERSLQNLKDFGFPKNKVLAAGIIDGRNIWRANLDDKLQTLSAIQQAANTGQLWIQPSCSLLHVPVTIASEKKMNLIIKSALSFADEKIRETAILTEALQRGYESIEDALNESKRAIAAFNELPARKRQEIREETAKAITPVQKRQTSFSLRKEKQHAAFKLPLLPTTTIGSFPQTPEVRQTRTKWRKGELTDSQYQAFVQSEIAKWIEIQENLQLDVLVHGEFERTDMVEYFGEKLDGVLFSEKAWVQSYGSRCVKPPIIYGDVAFTEPMTVKETVYAQSLTKKPVKGMLTGPVTILNWSFARDDLSLQEVTNQIALALQKEVSALEEAGISMIQIDEPALREGLPLKKADQKDYLNWAVNAFRATTVLTADTTQIHTHMCYCDFNHFIDSISALDADVISIETSRSHGEIIEAFDTSHYDKDIGLGVYDIHSPRVPSIEEITSIINHALEAIDPHQFWINPDCGLKTRRQPETIAALENMVKAAKEVRSHLKILQS